MPADDDEASGPPPHPLDRVWFHPSELGAPVTALRPQPAAPRVWVAAALALVIGILGTLGVVSVVGTFDNGTPTNRLQRTVATPVDTEGPRQAHRPAPGKEWWDSLSPEERQWLADDEPGRIGNLNGIPVAIRDYANRKATRQDLERVRRAAGSADVSAEVVLPDPGRYGLIQSDVTRYAMPKASRAASNSTVRRTPTTSRRTRSFGEGDHRV